MIKATCQSSCSKDSEQEVDDDLARFALFVRHRNLGPELSKPERAIIKTYLYWKLWGAMEKAAPDEGGPAQGLRVGGKF